jgi:UDP-sugar transporter A1/2/3
MHYSRTATSSESGKLYSSSTAVVTMELVKMVTCLGMVTYERAGVSGLITSLRDEVLLKPDELLSLSVPSIMYSIQNNLLYYALSHLDAATFQVGYQLKLLTTAVFSYFMLDKRLGMREWMSLIMLTAGVSLAQMAASKSASEHMNTTGGFIAVLMAAMTSGFSGVYFERIVKTSGTSLWMRNIQMGIGSIISALIGVYLSGELPAVREYGFFHGYNTIVISVVLLQAIGGLIVAVVVKYADNILKGFAASFSIITSCILSYFFFDFSPNLEFVIGAILVNVSMYMYSTPVKVKQEDAPPANVTDKV